MTLDESSKNCSVCGIPNDSGNEYCINCNSSLKGPSAANLTNNLVKPVVVTDSNKKGKSVFYFILPIIIIAALVYSFTGKSSVPIFSASKEVPSVTCDASIEKESKDFEWKYDGKTFKWHIEASKELLAYDRDANRNVTAFYDSDARTQWDTFYRSSGDFRKLVKSVSENGKGDFNIWLQDESNAGWAAKLAEQLDQSAKENGYNDEFHRAEFALSFVGSAIPYQISRFPQFSAQTVFDNGDCKDKSILLGAILRPLGYRLAFLLFLGTKTTPGHMALGIAFTDDQIPKERDVSYYEYQGNKYYFAETTSPNWPLAQASVEKPADIILIAPADNTIE